MNKKNIGAALSVVAAVAAGATVYASTLNNLESDKNTNSLIAPSYLDAANEYYSLVKSDYTNDLKNTAIAKEERVVQNTNENLVDVLKVEKAAKEIVASTIAVNKNNNQTALVAEEVEEAPSQAVVEETTEIVEPTEIVVEAPEVSDNEEVEVAEAETTEVVDNEEEIVEYQARNLDELLVDSNKEDLEVAEEVQTEAVNYLVQNEETEEAEAEVLSTKEAPVEAASEENTEVQAIETPEETTVQTEEVVVENPQNQVKKFVNTLALNVRNSKDATNNTNIVKVLVAGDEVVGTVEGEWIKTNDGYVNTTYLVEYYPQDFVNSIVNEEKIESTVVEETVTTEETAVEEAPVVETVEEVVYEEIEEPEVQEEVIELKEESNTQAFTGWVYNTNVLNVRDKAVNGNIIGGLSKGTKVNGEIADGWVKFDYNGKTAYVSATYLSTTEPANNQNKPAENNQASQNEEVKAVEEVVDEEEIIVEEEQQQAPVVNANGQKAANIASQYAGYPYVWGSTNPAVGFDCSGLVSHVYSQLGVKLPNSSQVQWNSGYAVSKENLQPGDIVFFSIDGHLDHVGIVTSSDGTFIHASSPKNGVKYNNIYTDYYQRTYAGARRIF